jgi:hypothetical protein
MTEKKGMCLNFKLDLFERIQAAAQREHRSVRSWMMNVIQQAVVDSEVQDAIRRQAVADRARAVARGRSVA